MMRVRLAKLLGLALGAIALSLGCTSANRATAGGESRLVFDPSGCAAGEGELVVRVRDSMGTAIPTADVQLVALQPGAGPPVAAVTDEAGETRMRIAGGSGYVLVVLLRGFKPLARLVPLS